MKLEVSSFIWEKNTYEKTSNKLQQYISKHICREEKCIKISFF